MICGFQVSSEVTNTETVIETPKLFQGLGETRNYRSVHYHTRDDTVVSVEVDGLSYDFTFDLGLTSNVLRRLSPSSQDSEWCISTKVYEGVRVSQQQ